MEASPVHGHTSPFYDSLFWFGLFLPRGFYSFGIHRQTFKTLQGYHILPETFLDLVIVLGVNSMWPTLHYIHCHPASLPGPWVSKSSDWWCYLFSASIYLIKPRYIGQVLSLSLQNKQKKKKKKKNVFSIQKFHQQNFLFKRKLKMSFLAVWWPVRVELSVVMIGAF